MEKRKQNCFNGEPIFVNKWYKEVNGTQHYFAVCELEGFIDFSIETSWLGSKQYIIYNTFNSNDIIKYVNYMYDLNNLNFEEILEQNIFINEEIKNYLLQKKSYKWDEFGLSDFGNYTGDDIFAEEEVLRDITLEKRKKQIKNKNNLNPNVLPPWYCNNMFNLCEEEAFILLLKKLDINNKFIDSGKADSIIFDAYIQGNTPEMIAKKMTEQTIKNTIKEGWIGSNLLDRLNIDDCIEKKYLELTKLIKINLDLYSDFDKKTLEKAINRARRDFTFNYNSLKLSYNRDFSYWANGGAGFNGVAGCDLKNKIPFIPKCIIHNVLRFDNKTVGYQLLELNDIVVILHSDLTETIIDLKNLEYLEVNDGNYPDYILDIINGNLLK